MSTLYKEWMASPPDSPSDIQHYGVMGMKWGIRKAQEYTNRVDLARRNAALQRIQSDTTIDAQRKKQLKKLAKADYKKAKSMNKAGANRTKQVLKQQIKSGMHVDENKQILRDKAIASLEKEFPGFSRYAGRIDAANATRVMRIVQNAIALPLGGLVIPLSNPSGKVNKDMARSIQSTEGFNQYMNDLFNRRA